MMTKTGLLGCVLLSGAVGVVAADPGSLAGGALATHYVPEIAFSYDAPPGGWCGAYEEYAVEAIADQNCRIDVSGSRGVCWFVLAAWQETKLWCGIDFGLGGYDERLFGAVDHGPCCPGTALEIPSPGWPAPNTGTAVVSMGSGWSGRIAPVYFFTGYVYAEVGPASIPLAADPATGRAEAANCSTPSQAWEFSALGALGINMDGTPAYPLDPPAAVCCIDDSCCLRTEQQCEDAGGQWYPHLVSCEEAWDSNPCVPAAEAVCCLGADCVITTQVDCLFLGGFWLETLAACEPNPCLPQPTQPASWGRLRQLYR